MRGVAQKKKHVVGHFEQLQHGDRALWGVGERQKTVCEGLGKGRTDLKVSREAKRGSDCSKIRLMASARILEPELETRSSTSA